jgi:hypothetical protein
MPQPANDDAVLERLVRLRRAHEILARELSSLQRRLYERDREIRELRTRLEACG